MTYRVALVHSFYSSHQPSGENTVVLDQAEALRAAGHEVTIVAAHTDALQAEPGYTLRAAVRVATGHGRSPLAELERLAPDVVHVHNLFPNFGTSWLERWPGALVATVHNYRPACAAGTLFRDERMCTACPDGDRWAGLRHGCYRAARSATFPLAWAGRRGPAMHPVLRRANRLVVLSEYSRNFYLGFGLPPRKLALVPNFVDASGAVHTMDSTVEEPAMRWLFAGRLSEEKGIVPLLQSWPENEPLDVIGSGPLESACRAAAPKGVRLIGALSRQQLRDRLPCYTGLIFPSVCPEMAPVICQEALAAGLPVLALAGSAAADSVLRHGTGAVYKGAHELPHALTAAHERFPALRERCRRVHAERYAAPSWTATMASVYAQAIECATGPRRIDIAEAAC
ncbi:glycosyltransferase family 4 protein [Streptomyces canus]|uniref:glycosyltransferase family 4 protein n=1 Tax=Streptomyces canus TaxID=58343 RepID=UPI0027D82817|nr:glycosyltransferase family 4 protein [Streptomyces canus]